MGEVLSNAIEILSGKETKTYTTSLEPKEKKPNGLKNIAWGSKEADMAKAIQTGLKNFDIMTAQTYEDQNVNGAPLPGPHAYAIIGVKVDTAGNVTSITVRNPWNADGKYGSVSTWPVAQFFQYFPLITIQNN
jgi:hypothetical protein